MTDSKLFDVPSSIRIDGKVCLVVDTMKNYHYRALVLPPLNAPRWLSNQEVGRLTGQLKDTPEELL